MTRIEPRSYSRRCAILGPPREIATLPLLGRLGGPSAWQVIDKSLSADGEEKEAAVRGLCNWPDASVSDRLMSIITQDEDKRFQRWALRAYVRVVSLPSERPEKETLAMLQNAMQHADMVEDQRLIIQRTATVRNMDAVHWIAEFLDQAGTRAGGVQVACGTAHHRELRHPNMQQFGPLLDRIAQHQ